MYQDARLLLSGSISATDNSITPQSIVGTGNILSTNTIDLSQARDIGEGADLSGRFQIGTAVAGATSVEFQIITADDAALTTNVYVVGTTGAIPVASLTAGARMACDLNPRIASRGQRYIGARYVVTGTSTTGTVIGDIGLEIQDGQKFYPTSIVVAS